MELRATIYVTAENRTGLAILRERLLTRLSVPSVSLVVGILQATVFTMASST